MTRMTRFAVTQPPESAELDAYFTDLGQGVNPWLERHAQRRELHRLLACSEEDLRTAGLERREIPARVFGSRFDPGR